MNSATGTRAVCVWESESLDSVRDCVETTAGAITTNEYFEVDQQKATGLPTGATAGATR
jgi:hypothetical protein